MGCAVQDGMQIIIQSQGRAGFSCEGFRSLPIVQPCQIVLASFNSTASEEILIQRLGAALKRHVMAAGPSVVQVGTPCLGGIGDPTRCHANGEQGTRKLLVLVGDGALALPPGHMAYAWRSNGHEVLPLLPFGADVFRLLPGTLGAINAQFYRSSVEETLSAIFVRAGLIPEDSRIFISYRRKDSQDLAEQLFEALAKENFDVFVDRFRVPPGVDFQARLSQELQDKSMVLVIESANILDSEWTRYELDFARSHRLGVLALHLPGGVKLPGLDDGYRLPLSAADLTGPPTRATDAAIAQIVSRVKTEHDRALLWRRHLVRDAVVKAALVARLRPSMDASGLIRVEGGSAQAVVVWTTPRSPGVSDFREAYTRRGPTSRAVVVGPSAFNVGPRLVETAWLSQVSKVMAFDEGAIHQMMTRIATGRL